MTYCLQETTSARKNKIALSDYNYQKDIQNRLLMSQFSAKDLEILEEILYSPLQVPLSKLAKNLDLSPQELIPFLERLVPTGLLSFNETTIFIDKEGRKYFEMQMSKFDEDFEPGMEFLQSLLKKPPIHVLPLWYATPRTADNIFESIVERYLLTPQIFQRYVSELNFGEPVLKQIIEDVYTSKDLELTSSFLMQKYHISRELFEEYMLHLEFNFVCCIGYQKQDNVWIEKVTPFHEWKEYLLFLRSTEKMTSPEASLVKCTRPFEYSFVDDLTLLLEAMSDKPLPLNSLYQIPLQDLDPTNPHYDPYLDHLVRKLELLRLASLSGESIQIEPAGKSWLSLGRADKSLYLYRHPLNCLLHFHPPSELRTEKALREAEKTITNVLNKGWVFFDEFSRGILPTLHEGTSVTLQRIGKTWKYAIPTYTETELQFVEAVIFEWLFEAGIVQTGTCNGRKVFRVTSLGQTLFAR